jgi:hypothetical protein
MERLAKRLSVYPGTVAVAEPTSMTWLPLALALNDVGCSLAPRCYSSHASTRSHGSACVSASTAKMCETSWMK